jgi:hypothetical protein
MIYFNPIIGLQRRMTTSCQGRSRFQEKKTTEIAATHPKILPRNALFIGSQLKLEKYKA